MATDVINRARPDVYEDNVGMMSTAIHWSSWGEVTEGRYAGYAEGATLGMEIHTGVADILGTKEFGQEVYDAIAATLTKYEGVEWTNGDAEVLCVEFGVSYEDNETHAEMVERIRHETGFMRLYNDGVIMTDFTVALAKRLGRRRYVNDFEGDGWVPIEDTTTPDVYYRNGEREVVMPRPC